MAKPSRKKRKEAIYNRGCWSHIIYRTMGNVSIQSEKHGDGSHASFDQEWQDRNSRTVPIR
ncbi:hypothetical protein KHA80_12575 [Anaerobacillus sp. HL2]|nr:hypothetical protein KHA80_12575 [Anaerobacillus sp. HL2]